jgi:hypothetical protein
MRVQGCLCYTIYDIVMKARFEFTTALEILLENYTGNKTEAKISLEGSALMSIEPIQLRAT